MIIASREQDKTLDSMRRIARISVICITNEDQPEVFPSVDRRVNLRRL
jgi:hypothetical protein